MQNGKGMPRKYVEYAEGWNKALKESGWGEKFKRAEKEGITKALILEYQLAYAKKLIDIYINSDTCLSISEILEFVKQETEEHATEETVREQFRIWNTPGMWAYLTFYYF